VLPRRDGPAVRLPFAMADWRPARTRPGAFLRVWYFRSHEWGSLQMLELRMVR